MFFEAKYKREYLNDQVFIDIKLFWEWFEYNKTEIEGLILKGDKRVLQLFENEFKKIFKLYSKQIPLSIGFNEKEYTLYIHYGRNSYLLTIGDSVMEEMPRHLKNNWTFLVVK